MDNYTKLKEELKQACENYYYSDKPLMSDALYDKKYKELQAIEDKHPEFITPDSPTQKVGASIVKSKGFKKVKHSHPMLSLKTETDYTEQGAIAFDKRIKELLKVIQVDYYCEPKFDGLGLDLTYHNGVFVQALTRGDGEYGEDVTANAMMIDDIPKQLTFLEFGLKKFPDLLIVRGEVLMFKDVFKQLNEQCLLDGKKEYSNTRNAAAGALRQLDPLKTKERKLNFFAYTLVEISEQDNNWPTSHCKQMVLLKRLGFPICDLNWLVYKYDYGHNLNDYHSFISNVRTNLPYEIDGVVYKVDSLDFQRHLGYIGREPKWAVAHKFPAEIRETKLLAIDIQVGRTGKLTPVARLQPVQVGGVIVSNVTLHNEGEIHRKDVRVGDIVLVRRAGDVIPEIVGSINTEEIAARSPMFQMPIVCPVCGSAAIKDEDEADYRCSGELYCPAQRKQAILHFIQRGAVEINGLGESLVDKLLENNYITNVADLYSLDIKTLMEVDRISDISANNILNAIETSKKTTLRKFIYGLGIRNAGEGTAKRLVKQLGTLDRIMNASVEELLSIKDVGPIVATSVYTFFHQAQNIDIINRLKSSGVYWDEIQIDTTNEYAGKTVAVSGTFTTYNRQTIKDKLEALGANVTSSVGKSTNLLIAGPGAGSKLVQAKAYGIEIIDEETFIESIKENNGIAG